MWRTVAAVARTPGRRNKPELLILFPLQMGIVRLLTTSKAMSLAWEERVDRVFPGPDWRRVYKDRLADKISPTDAKSKYVDFYCEGLQRLGYRHTNARLVSSRAVAGAGLNELYYLIFASDSDTGDRIMRDVMSRSYDLDFPVTQQPRLPHF